MTALDFLSSDTTATPDSGQPAQPPIKATDFLNSPTPSTTAGGAFARGAATNVAPSFGAWGGAKAGFMLGETIGGGPEDPLADVLGVVLGIGGAITGSIMADKAQQKLIQKADPEAYQTLQKYQQEDLKDHPMASAIGDLAGSIPAFRFGSPVQTAKGLKSIYKLATGAATTDVEKKLAKNLATQIGVGTAGSIVAPLIQGEKPTAAGVTQAIAQTLLFGDARFGGKVPSGVTDVRPESEKSNASNQPSTEGVPSNPQGQSVDAQAPLRQQGEVAEAPQGEAQIGATRSGGVPSPQGNVRLTPALLVDGKPIMGGKTHQEIWDNHVADKNVSATDATKITEAFNDDANHVFVDQNGKVYDRQQAAQVAGVKVSDPKAGLKSEDLLAAKPAAPAKAATTELKPAEIIALPRQDFFKYMDSKPGGLTREAWRVGQAVKTPEEVAQLKSASDAIAPEFQKAMAAKDLDTAGFLAQKRQFFNEAYGAATGTGSAGLGLKRENASYEPPVSVDPATGKITFKATPVEKPATAPEAVPESQPGVGGARAGSKEFSGGTPDIQGVRQRTRETQARAGLPVEATPGVGISTEASIEQGRAALAKEPTAADKAAQTFETTGKLSSEDFNVARAKYDEVQAQGRVIESRFGTNSPEYQAARGEIYKWSKLTKDMQTEWHRLGQAQQRITDIDTGSVLALENEFHDTAGKDFTPLQRDRAGKFAKKVNDQTVTTEKNKADFNAELQKKAAEASQTDEQAKATKKALDAANKTVRENAIRIADKENELRKIQQDLKTQVEQVQRDAAAKAKQATTDVARRNAIDAAKKETVQRVADAKRKTATAQIQLAAAKKALQAAHDVARRNAIDTAKAAARNQAHPEIAAWAAVKKYLDAGLDNFDEIRSKVAADLGMPTDKLTGMLTKTKSVKDMADKVWKAQQDLRRFKDQAKQWLRDQAVPGYLRALQKIPRLLFGMKVGFHGTVALGTHAPAVAFQPNFWGTYVKNFIRMYQMVGSTAYHEMQMQDLVRRPNYLTARRAGLVNDPFQVEDYNDPNVSLYAKYMLAPGQRGYAVLKTLRQDMFDQHWGNLPKTAQTPEVAQAIADGINHATGVVKARAPSVASFSLFAPRLEASRAAWLAVDPAKAVNTFINWKNASLADKTFAIHQAKEKAYVMATMLSLLGFNQAMLNLTGSKQKINFDNPMQSDWLKFKVAGKDLAYGNAMLAMARFPARLWQIRESDGGKLKNLIYPDEDTYTAAGEYARSQFSPIASLLTDLAFKSDWERRPLPNSNRPVPPRLRAQGVKPYTWPEFFADKLAPIPAEEAVSDVFKALHTDKFTFDQAMNDLAATAVMMGTGARLTEDVAPKGGKGDNFVWAPPQQTQKPASILNE